VTRREKELDRTVAEEVVIAIDQDETATVAAVVAGGVGVALDHDAVMAGGPFTPLDHERNRHRDERQSASVIPVQMRETTIVTVSRSTCSASDSSCSNLNRPSASEGP
jgi:hypothetical protein